ncbi:MAG TPA: filamentous hemagglutinin N-terminal domain-containing protein [Candidatus Fusicatenibacter intestinipullorum]|nr:filamentous hemagglutinin N-terminal domain-containing protein [Candidatus Fusicatenibacter intestinipullorum]
MNSKKNLKRNLLICLLAGSAVMYTLPLYAATSVIGNGTLPSGGHFVTGGADNNIVIGNNGLQMDITQSGNNAVITWKDFNVGGSATVNFWGPENHNTLNYVNGGNMSQIYGTINANNNGNIFIVNPAGVQIGNSAQINVGSLYVSNKYLNEDKLGAFAGTITPEMINATKTADAALMSLGNINASKVTFEGDGRIVIDSERLKDVAGTEKLTADKIFINTKDENNLVIGYDGYDENNGGSYNTASSTIAIATVNSNGFAQNKGYMWVEDVEQLQDIGESSDTLKGNYALRNSIDGTQANDFTSIGNDTTAFTGKFDGIDYNIFNLNINGENNVGLFGKTDGATISNVTLVGGSITGKDNVGAIVGSANNTTLTNVVNSAAVSGNSNVGGIVGSADDSAIKDAINTGTINGSGYNVGGLIGNLQNSKLDTTKEVEKGLIGNSYNLGDVSGNGYNVGGLVGSASNSTIGDGTNLVYNRMDVTGAYNVGGIVGNMVGSTVQNAENSGTVLASGSVQEDYIFHSDYAVNDYNKHDINGNAGNGYGRQFVDVANVGGIAGTSSGNSIITDVLNTGDVSSSKVEGQEYYAAGNVGGIVGKAVDTNISNATNKENEVRGAHNVGGIAGYFGGNGIIKTGINDGGDIMATGARNGTNFVTEIIRSGANATEEFTVGNIGGVVGYMFGDNVYIDGGANRGTVHTDEPADPADVKDWQKAANVGGIVGKIDRASTKNINDNNVTEAAVSNSYNTGDVLGYTGIGGIAGMMYNGEIAKSYNLGYLRSTRQSQVGGSGKVIDALNMGGIVGDTTEESNAKVYLYDVYNKGQIGDKEFKYFGRHIGGIVGRLSGTVEKAYNTGAIYNGYNVVGGIVGWMHEGSVNNVFNTGNITVYNQNNVEGQIGGIVGAAHNTIGDINISNAYNLGTIRGFKGNGTAVSLGGILGFILAEGRHSVNISNVYTTGNLYADDDNLYSIYGANGIGKYTINNAYYIKPQDGLEFTNLNNPNNTANDRDNSNKAIAFDKKDDIDEYQYGEGENHHSLTFTKQSGGDVNGNNDNNWRIYDGNTPILNAFLPNTEDYFYDKNLSTEGITSIQYGSAYDPLLTIIKANGNKADLTYNWSDLGISNAAGLVVYGAGLTLNKVNTSGGSGYFGGTIYADGALNLNGGVNDIGLGSAADIYGSAVNITTGGKVTIYGDVTATGNGTMPENYPDTDGSGSITITASDVDVYGTLTSASNTQGAKVKIPGIEDSAVTWTPGDINNPYASMADIADRFAHTTGASAVDGNITITANGTPADVDGDGKIEADEVIGGNVNLYFGNKEQGLITTGGDLTVTGTGDVYVDSDLDIGGDMTLTSTGADSEVLLTLTNIGKVQANRFNAIIENAINGIEITRNNEQILTDAILNAVNKAGTEHTFTGTQAGYIVDALIASVVTDKHSKVEAINELNNDIAVEYMHDFMHSFDKDTANYIALNAASGDAKLTVDMWVEDVNGSKFDFTKYDSNFTGTGDGHKFINELENLNFYVNDDPAYNQNAQNADASKYVYVEVSTGEQLKAIQNAGSEALGYNYALMGDINASDVEDYVAIGTGDANGFTGTFDGRGNRIIGLDTTKDSKGGNSNTLTNAGIFSTVGEGGVVKDVNIYSGTFTGTTTAGAVAGVNNGRIEGIVTFGNTVTVTGDNSNVSNAGGIVGVNNSGTFENNANDGELTGGIYDVESTGSVIAGSSTAVAGGLVGTNDGGLANSFSDSAVTVGTNVTGGTSAGLGGVVGVNTEKGNVQYVDSLGVTNGGATGSSNIGGIIGTNNGNMYSGYNESIVSGKDNVGGIIGENNIDAEVSNIVNATSVTGEDKTPTQDDDDISKYVGGLVGTNSGSVTNGRNNGTITGTNYVGGMVGSNEADATLKNLVNDSSASITGEQYVGGIAGDNAGTITTGNEETDETVNLINRGTITGQQYVGGVAGSNSGIITNANNDVELNVKDGTADAKFFGGIAGVNTGTINNATNTADVNADGAAYVGGIVGENNGILKDMAGNSGNVTGGKFVGGVAGLNTNNKPLDGVEASNTGTVFATGGGAGGIFAVNNANITNSKLTNNGTVIGNGGNGTGGIFGVNTGNISTSSLINEVDGQVIGTNNVGGLIGKNTGTIIGGRDDADSYYKYKIYNNGVINVGTYKDENGDGKYVFYEQNGNNIGGLIGNNTTENGKTGSLTAGYNTGAINASGSTNVGGIAGSNSGKIDQVFNTVMVKPEDKNNGQKEAITGGSYVGGLVGNNSGTLSNAYNTTSKVNGNADSTGNLVGTNSGTVQYVYGVAKDLIGSGIGSIENYHVIDGSDKWLQEGTYAGFTFGAKGWKIYDGSTLPMLSVFLTKVTVVDQHLVDQYFSAKHYGEFHQITADDIKALIAIGAISAPDGFGAFNNNNSLIQGVGDDAMANSGNWLYSDQIADSFVNGIFNPNNLGYDISLVYSPFELDNDPSSRWNYLFNDAPFDRNKDFRERKAEVNFVDGGMEI